MKKLLKNSSIINGIHHTINKTGPSYAGQTPLLFFEQQRRRNKKKVLFFDFLKYDSLRCIMIKKKRVNEEKTRLEERVRGKGDRRKALAAFLLSLILLLGFPAEVVAQTLKTTTNLRLRSGPSTDAEILEIIPRGTGLEILDTTGNWARTSYSGGGYVGLKYLEAGSGSGMTRVTTNLRLRSGPSTGFSIRAVVPKDTAVPVLEKEGNFVKTVWDGKVGWLGIKYTEAFTRIPQREVTAEVNFRKGPGTSHAIIRKLQPGTRITVLSHSGSWIKTAHNGSFGWLSLSYTRPLGELMPRVTAGETKLLAAPDPTSSVLTAIPEGSLLPVTRESGEWIHTSWNGRNGYIRKEATRALEELPQRVTTGSVNFRRGAGSTFSVIETLPPGTSVPFFGQSGDWVYSWYHGNSGWLHRNYLRFPSDPSRPDAPPAGLLEYSNARHSWSHSYPQDSNYGYPEFGGAYRYGDGKVYLTFDYGWENGLTPKYLDTLKEKGIRSIMYVTGYYLRTEPALVRRMLADGHIVANHSDKHPDTVALMETSMQAVYDDLRAWEAEYRSLTGSDPEGWYYRAPSGIFSQRIMALLHWMGYQTEFWDVAVRDWDVDDQLGEEETLELLMAQTRPGSIVLLHPVSTTNEKILARYIDAIRAKGWAIGDPHQLGR